MTALATGISFLNGIFNIAGIGLGIGSIALAEQLKGYSQKIHDLVNKNKDLIKSSASFQSTVQIITSPVLKTQQTKVEVIIKSTLQSIQEYYEGLRKLMLQKQSSEFNTILKNLPGSLSITKKAITGTGYALFIINVLSAIHGVYQTRNLYNKWRNNRLNPPPEDDYPIGEVLGQTESATSQVVKNSYDVTPVTKTPVSIENPQVTQIKANSATFRQFFGQMVKIQGRFFQRSTFTFSNVSNAVGLIAGIVGFGLSIYGIIDSEEAIQQAKKQLQEVKDKLKQFYNQCLGVLYSIQQFLDGFQAQILSFSVFLSYIQLLCTHNILATDSTTDSKKFASYIQQLKIEQINSDTLAKIRDAKEKMRNALDGMVITRSTAGNSKDNQITYSTQQSKQSMSKRFSLATGIFVDLDQQINITKIFNVFYDKLKLAYDVVQTIDFEKTKKYLSFVSSAASAYRRNRGLESIEDQYIYTYNLSDDYQFTPSDQYKIAQAISFTTNTFPKNSQKTTVYGIELSSFKQKLTPQDMVQQTTEIQDLDMGNIMGSWPEDRKKESIQEILKHTNSKTLTADKLTYWGSSIYIFNNGDAVTPKWQLSRLQAFDAPIQGSSNKQRYYVLYDSTTNQFDKVVPGPMDKLSDIKLPSS